MAEQSVWQMLGFKGRRGKKHFANATEYPSDLRNTVQLYGVSGTYGGIYKVQPAVRTVVEYVAEEFATCGVKLFERVSKEKRLELDDAEVMKLLRTPSPTMSPFKMWYGISADIGVYDVAYLGKVRGARGRVIGLVRVPPSALYPDTDPVTGRVRRYRTSGGGTVEKEDLVIFGGYHPESTEDQIPPIETIRRILAETYAMDRYREGMWRNAARVDGIIERPPEAGEWDDEAREGFLAEFENAYTGQDNSGRVAILEGMTWKDVHSGLDSRAQEYVNARKLSRAEVAAMYHVPPELVDGTPSKEARTAFYSGHLNALFTRVEDDLRLQLLPEFEAFDADARQYFEFNLQEKLKGSFEEQAAIMSTATGGPWLIINEARAMQNLPPVPGGDKLMIPMNTVAGGGDQASPQSPTETPATDAGNVEPAGTTPSPDRAQPKAGVKAGISAREVVAVREPVIADFAELLVKTYSRQQRAFAGSGSFDSKRWNTELTADLAALYVKSVAKIGDFTAERIKGSFDSARTEAYWDVTSDALARQINDGTLTRLSRTEDPAALFETLIAEAPAKAQGYANHAVNWALLEAAKQNGRV